MDNAAPLPANDWNHSRGCRCHVNPFCLLVLLAALAPRASLAAEPPTAAPPPAGLEEIVVSATRIERSGFEAPTPLTVLSGEEMQKRGLTKVIDLLNSAPSFRASQTPAGGSTSNALGAGFSYADLRGLGSQRTLVLVDGRRYVPSAASGQVDLNLIPSILLDHADVVTGGASAAWGSDAVAGVVNLVLKDRLNGFISDISAGESQYQDDRQYRIALADGQDFAAGKGHIVVGGEYVKNDGIPANTGRDWFNQDYGLATNPTAGANGFPKYVLTPSYYQNNLHPGGIITSGPLRGTYFDTNGAPGQFDYPAVLLGNAMIGKGVDSLTGQRIGLTQQYQNNLEIPLERYSLFANGRYDINDHLAASLQLSFGNAQTHYNNGYPRDSGLTINVDNAFLPAAVRQAMINDALTKITVGRYDIDLPLVSPSTDSTTERAVLGLEGSLAGSWKWNAYAEIGQTRYRDDQPNNRINANFNAAIDAVRNSSGDIVCRNPNLVTGLVTAAPGCVPLDIFGQGSPSVAAINYVTGNGWGEVINKQQVGAVNLNGEPFSTWAGPVSLATGVEYRHESASGTSDPLSQLTAFNIGNPQAIHGKYGVREIYGETVVPLLTDTVWAKTLELNAAGRRTDYSTSGAVTTWKGGMNFEPISDVRFRGTRSRDIRAPNLSELYGQSQFSRPLIANPWASNIQTNVPVNNGIGNPMLKPEVADTTTYGVVFEPRWVRGLKVSVDMFDIKINEVIASVGGQAIVNRCFAGATEYCQYVGGAGTATLTYVNNTDLNLNRLRARGTDLEATYLVNLPISDLSVRLLATHTDELSTTDSGGTENRAGQVGAGSLVGAAGPSVPHWLGDLLLTYHQNSATLSVDTRLVGGGLYDAGLVGADQSGYSQSAANSINRNVFSSVFYVDLGAQYDLSDKLQLYGTIINLANRIPPPTATTATVTNNILYDVIGRRFTVGFRFKL